MKEDSNKMKTEKRKTGDLGELIAVRFLEGKGYKVIDRNYLKPWGEIDIVAQKENIVHFIEVKTVSHETVGFRAEDNVHEYKLKRLERTINSYLIEKKEREREWQLDLVVVSLDTINKKSIVKLTENIF